ncbi:Poly [ADP-ribose] polymerase 2 [Orobanche gracilis]
MSLVISYSSLEPLGKQKWLRTISRSRSFAPLAQRGLGVAGMKPILVRRLEAALRDESEESLDLKSDSNTSRKSLRDSNGKDGNSEAPRKIKAIDELRSMNVKQLREEASNRGVSTSGTKKELLERLCASDGNDSSDNGQVKEKKEKIVTATRKGSAVLDKCLPEHIKMQYHVLQVGDEIYDAMLNQTNVMENNNKFFVLQVIESDDGGRFMVYFRWGRVGVKGQDKLSGPYTSQQAAISEFENKFFDKTKNHWFDREDFYSHPRSYTWLEMDYSETKNERTVQLKPESTRTLETKGSKLEACIAKFISLICNMSMMRQQIMEIGYNAEKLPLGKLSKSTILKFGLFVRLGKALCIYNNGIYLLQQRRDVQLKPKSTLTQETKESKLEARIAKFISLICNMSMMRQQMMEIGYNAEKLPLGKLSKSTILKFGLFAGLGKGYGVLKRIADVISQADRKTLEQLSGEFYTVIPHDFGFKETGLFVIDTPQKLKNKLEMVEALGEIEVAMKLIGDDTDMEIPYIVSIGGFIVISCHLKLILILFDFMFQRRLIPYFQKIQKYTRNTHAKTHSNYDVDIIQIFKVSREGEAERFEKFAGTKNKMLLWHGSRLTNWTGILSQGYMFGKGVYFADMFSKSANYCCSTKSANAGVLLLCEVALGDMAELLTANHQADKLPAGKLSTKGVGSTAPDLSEAATLGNGVVVPLGRPKEQSGPKGALRYNEYIVYNVEQIRMRYIVNVNFNSK